MIGHGQQPSSWQQPAARVAQQPAGRLAARVYFSVLTLIVSIFSCLFYRVYFPCLFFVSIFVPCLFSVSILLGNRRHRVYFRNDSVYLYFFRVYV